MQIQQIKVSDLKPYEKNAKEHTQKQIEQVAASINKFGFLQPLVIDSNNVVIVGHGRLLAAQHLKMEIVPCISAKNLTEVEVKAYRLADNKLNESAWDMELAIIELEGLELDLQELTGFSLENLEEPIIEKPKNLKSIFEVVVECVDEEEQEVNYNKLEKMGFKCRIISI